MNAAVLDGARLSFFSDSRTIVARESAELRLPDGTRARADGAYVDLRRNVALLAGNVRIVHGARSRDADAAAFELTGQRIDLLDVEHGASATTRALADFAATAPDPERFAAAELDERHAFIRSRHAVIVPNADVRFVPAAFPAAAGAVPVPSFLYSFASAAGLSASSLAGASFDQPYGLFGTPNSLTALHARWLDGSGAALALQQQLASGDDAYLAASVDAPLRGTSRNALQAYRRLDARSTLNLDASTAYGTTSAQLAFTRALHGARARLQYGITSYGASDGELRLRSSDRPLLLGATWSVAAGLGYAASPGALLWRHSLEGTVSSPMLHGPLGTRLAATLGARRTQYGFPHHTDDLSAGATLSRDVTRKLNLMLAYAGDWGRDVYPGAQAVYYPPSLLPPVAPDGTPWTDRAAYTGATDTARTTLTMQLTPDASTSLRVAVSHVAAFPQFHGYGQPPWEVRWDARLRPFPNVGLALGRAYDFGWGNTRWVPRWTFAVTP